LVDRHGYSPWTVRCKLTVMIFHQRPKMAPSRVLNPFSHVL
jgi:hypothetical protein